MSVESRQFTIENVHRSCARKTEDIPCSYTRAELRITVLGLRHLDWPADIAGVNDERVVACEQSSDGVCVWGGAAR